MYGILRVPSVLRHGTQVGADWCRVVQGGAGWSRVVHGGAGGCTPIRFRVHGWV
jgi:hypothetical protein